jgi:anti-anti-sigma regulatory factor
MESVRFTCHADRTEVVFGRTLDASRVRAAYRHLDDVLNRGSPVELHAAGLDRIDAAGLQLLLAFVHAARTRGLKREWRSVSPALSASGELLGLSGALELPA